MRDIMQMISELLAIYRLDKDKSSYRYGRMEHLEELCY